MPEAEVVSAAAVSKLTSPHIELPPLDPALYASPAGGLLLVREAGEVVGLAGFRRTGEGVCELDPFKVSIYHRGRGIGGRLMRAVLARAAEAGYRRIVSRVMLWCPDYQAFYAAHGFRLSPDIAERTLS